MSAPRLNTIDGTDLGERLVDAYMTSLRAVSLHEKIIERVAARILIVRAVDDLVKYARGDGKLEAHDVDDHLTKLIPMLEHPLGGAFPMVIRSVLYDTIDPDSLSKDEVLDELALVIAAAFGRQALDRERDIRTSWLAAHCSVSSKTVERAKLKPARVKGWTSTQEARSWIATRNELEEPK